MSTEQSTSEPPKDRLPQILTYVAIAAVMFGAGMLLESRMASSEAATVKLAHDQEIKQARDRADEQQKTLTEKLEKEREEHANTIQTKDKSLASVANRAAGMRRALETELSAARTSGDACTSRINGISEALDGLFDSVGQVAGIAQDLGRENQQLKEDNKSLSEKLTGWQKWNTERMQRIIVNGKKE